MKLVLELKDLSDLEILLPLLKRLGITIIQTSETITSEQHQKPPLSKHIGVLPSIDVSAFETYLNKTRDEWERPIS
ncbi:MAG: hypothetical protein J5I98_30545 [Phaeodactylibacter sp.]|nr:hypothetical protein [Phaeodactylibacter sp.]